MAKNKSKKGAKKSPKPEETKLKTEDVVEAEVVKTEKVEESDADKVTEKKKSDRKDDEESEAETKTHKVIASKKSAPLKGFFACKHDKSENILTIFKNPRIWSALIGEMLGTMLLLVFLQLIGIYPDLLFTVFAGVTLLTFTLSGAHLNPAISLAMIVSRRISIIRGVLYMLAQILGAWLGFLLQSMFLNMGEGTYEITTMAPVGEGQFWVFALVELIGATMLGFVFCRALMFKRRPLVFALTVGFGFSIAYLIMLVLSSRYLALSGNFMLNPALSLMFKILPTGGEDFGAVLGQTMQALCIYCLFPMIGAVIGFVISDIAGCLSGDVEKEALMSRAGCDKDCAEAKSCHCHCDK